MESEVPMASPQSLDERSSARSTRELLDELDVLMERMLTLPVEEESNPAAPDPDDLSDARMGPPPVNDGGLNSKRPLRAAPPSSEPIARLPARRWSPLTWPYATLLRWDQRYQRAARRLGWLGRPLRGDFAR